MSAFLAKEWIMAAKLDLANIQYIINDELLTPIASFHSQQATEKSLKALLASKKIDFKKIHSLEKLFILCKDYIAIDNYDTVDLLDSLYIESRYPGDFGLLPDGKPTLEDAQEFYEFAQEIFDEVCILLNIDPKEVKEQVPE